MSADSFIPLAIAGAFFFAAPIVIAGLAVALLHQKNSTAVSSFVEEHFLAHLMSYLILIVQF